MIYLMEKIPQNELAAMHISHIKGKAVPLHAMEALGGRGGIAPTHS
jgi:hypothetical protein